MEKLSTIGPLLTDLAAYSIIPVLVIALWRYPTANREQRLIAIFILFSAICEFSAMYIGGVLHRHNMWIPHVISPVRFIMLSWLFRDYFSPKFLRNLSIGFLAFALFDSIFIEDFYSEFNAIGRSVEAVLLISLSLGFFFQILRTLSIENLERYPLFWAATSILIYFSGSFVIYIFNNYILEEVDYSYAFGGIHGILLIVHYFLFGIALLVKPKEQE